MMSRASCEAVMSRNTSSSAPWASWAFAASTGSPASRRSTKRTPFTTRPSLTSRQGMIPLASMLGHARGGAHRVRQRDGAGVERAADDDALDARVGDRRQRRDVRDAANSARGENRHAHRPGERHRVLDIRSALGTVTRDVGIEEGRRAGVGGAATDVDYRVVDDLGPALHRHPRAARIDRDDDLAAEGPAHLAQERVIEGGARADHDPARAGLEDRLDGRDVAQRSEEHTSELQSLAYLVCRLLLEKKKKK